MPESLSLLSLFFPEGMLEYFEITEYKKSPENIDFYLNEKKIIPTEYKEDQRINLGELIFSVEYFALI